MSPRRFGSFTALDDVSLDVHRRRAGRAARPVGLGQDHAAAHHRRPGDARPGHGSSSTARTSTDQPVRERSVGFVFQHYALFRHMTVFENIAFGLRVRPRAQRPSKEEIRDTVDELLTLVQLEGLGDRYPSQLSGGQRQRVALARALAVEPKVLLLDEPFGALDAKVRKELRRWLRRLHDEMHVTSVFVTHDQEEALEVADRVVVMNQGRIEQVGTPEEVYDHPATPFVYGFLGNVNLFHGRVDRGRVMVGTSELEAPPEFADARDQDAVAYVRTYDVELTPSSNGRSSIEATVRHIRAFGPVVRLELDRADDGSSIEAHLPRAQYEQLGVTKGQRVFVSPTSVRVFAGSDGRKAARSA